MEFVPPATANPCFPRFALLKGIQRKPGGSAPLLPHLVPVHDDFPAVPLERLHPVLRPHAGGVSLRLLGPQGKSDGEIRIILSSSDNLFFTSSIAPTTLLKAFGINKNLFQNATVIVKYSWGVFRALSQMIALSYGSMDAPTSEN